MSELTILESVNAIEVFSGDGLDELLEKIAEESKSIVPDVTTAKGRAEIKSIAHKVAKSKTALDALGIDLVADWKQKSKAVDAERKKARDYLDNLKEEVRKPLTDWETAEAGRIAAHESNIQDIATLAETTINGWLDISLQTMIDNLTEIERTDIDDTWEEYVNDAAKAKDKASTGIRKAIERRKAHDTEQAELEQFRAEAAERDRLEAEEKLRKEGEERAKREAEAKAKEESERAERERKAAIQAKEDAERRAEEAEENSKRKAEQATQAERDRIEQERVAEEQAAKKREADKKHRAKINNAAVDALILAGLSNKGAKATVTAIAKGQVPYTRIDY